MLSRALRSILALSPKGRTTLQFVRLLEQASVRASRPEVLAALDEMRRRRQVTIDHSGHWQVRGTHPQSRLPDDAEPPAPRDPEADAFLHAVCTVVHSAAEVAEDDVFEDMADAVGPPPVGDLLSYYEATQKSDPRGAIGQEADQHEQEFQLFQGTEQWWSPSSVIAIELGDLPPTFRHALSKRNGDGLVIGYPLATLVEDGVCDIYPVGLMSASLSRTGYIFNVTPRTAGIVLNPVWIQAAGRDMARSAKALVQQLDAAEGLAFEDFHERLSDCMADQLSDRLAPDNLAGSIDSAVTGIHNAAAVFLPAETSFTKESAADLGQLARMPASALEGTALWNLLHGSAREETAETAGVVLNPEPLTPDQLEAAELALTGTVTAVTGPSGTGKSQVIVSIIASALAEDKTVLLASRDHRAIDAVEERLTALSPEQPVMVRANDCEGDRDTDFVRVIDDLADDDTHAFPDAIADSLHRLRDKVEARTRAIRDRAVAQRLHCALSEHIERRAEIIARVGENKRPQSNSLLSRLPRLLRFGHAAPAADILAPGATLDELDEVIERDQKALAGVAAAEDPILLSEDIETGMKALFPALAANALAIGSEDRHRLLAEQDELEQWGRVNAHEMTDHVALQVLACRPVWAVTTLSAPSRVPLAPGLFDYVIFDQANQCDVASALPLMARAKRAIVVGDPDQPESVPGLGPAQDIALMNAAGLPMRGMEKYAQSRNSLFGFCINRPGTRSVALRDQFRSAPAIVDYLNDAFCAGRLRAARDVVGLNVPATEEPGISWTDVRGRVLLDQAGQPRNRAEAKAIAEHLDVLLRDRDFRGSVGVMTPFNAQAALLKQLIENNFPQELQERAQIEIGTVDKFQDGERDVILFSPVAGPGFSERAHAFLAGDKRRFNIAISRARAVVHVFGNLSFARESGIRHLAILAGRATNPRNAENAENVLGSVWERRVDAALRERGLNPTPQYPTAGRYLDFALFGEGEVKLDLEVDGRRWHMGPDDRRKIDDMRRDYQLRNLGWRVRRFWVHELEQDMERCLDQVERDLSG